jgi:predicted ribosome quality control (RQC) complex YloA/Tae2 family protein
MVLQNEVEVVTKGDKISSKELDKKENDVRRKMKIIEDDIHLWQNNIEFFARSKNAASVRAEYESKIREAEKELSDLKQKLKIIISAF